MIIMDQEDKEKERANRDQGRRWFFTGFALVLWGLSVFWLLFAVISYSAGEAFIGAGANVLTALLTIVIGVLMFKRRRPHETIEEGVRP